MKTRFIAMSFIMICVLTITIGIGCGDEDSGPAPDTTSPATTTTLMAAGDTDSSLTLIWIAPGDDGDTGTASQYDIRYWIDSIGGEAWYVATSVNHDLIPKAAGSAEQLVVGGLSADTIYFFALKAADEDLNWSETSNVATDTTEAAPDITPPAQVTDIAVIAVTDSSATLTWSAPGDDGMVGTASVYDLRYSLNEMTEENWNTADVAQMLPAPGVAGAVETFTVERLASETRCYFALKAADDASNWSAMSNVDNVTTLSPPPDPFALRISPENLLLNLKAAYGLGDLGQFTDLLDPNFDFIFSEEDQGQPGTPMGLTKGDEAAIHTNMFSDLVDRLELDFNFNIEELMFDAEMTTSPADSVFRLDVTAVGVTLKGRLPGIPDMTPVTWQLDNGSQIFWFHKSGPDGELGELEPTTGEAYWSIVQWEETTISGSKSASDDASWGSIKSLYR
jgi:chitodextrinase